MDENGETVGEIATEIGGKSTVNMAETVATGSRMSGTTAGVSIGGVDDSTMDDIVDKLKVLNYEQNFCMQKTFRPLTHVYFSRPSNNPNEQFRYFTALVSWLMELCGHQWQAPSEFDDPIASATSLIFELKNMDFGVRDIAPGKLKQGHGDAVLHVLNMLADKVLVLQGWNWVTPEWPPDNYNDELDVDQTEEEEIQDDAHSESEGDEEFWDGWRDKNKDDKPDSAQSTGAIESAINPEEWRMELERVAPLLKTNRRTDHKDWRSHLDWIASLLKTIDKTFPDVKAQLDKIADDINKAIEKIQKREQALSGQFENYVENYRTHKKDYNAVHENFKTSSDNVNQLSNELNQISELVDQAKSEIQQKEERMTDTTPLIKIKEAMSKIKSEIKQMQLRIGVLQHSLLHYKVKQNSTTKATPQKSAAEALEEQDSQTF